MALPLIADRYRVQQELGVGATGRVLLAEDLRSGRPVALKTSLPQHRGTPVLRHMLFAAQRAMALAHPNVVRVLDVGRSGPSRADVWVAHAWTDGLELGRLAPEDLPTAQRLDLLRQLLAGLAHLHARGLLHRDVKPANALVERRGDRLHLSLIDLGLLRAAGGPDPWAAAGSAGYLAPECLAPPPRWSAASDVWAAGIVAWELLVGHRPADSGVAPSLRAAWPAGWSAEWSAEWSATGWSATGGAAGSAGGSAVALIDAMLAEEPGQRPAAGALVRALAPLCEAARMDAAGWEAVRRRGGEVAPLTALATVPDSQPEACADVPLWGRQGALDELGAALARAADGLGSVLVLTGPAGIGKTALLEAFAYQADSSGLARTLRVEEIARRGVVPALRSALERVDAGGHPAGGFATPGERQSRVFAALGAWAERGEGPALVLLDELPAGGADSRDLLRWLRQRAPGLPLLALAGARSAGALGLQEGEARVLSPVGATDVVEGLVRDFGLAPAAAAGIAARAAGVPLYARVLATATDEDLPADLSGLALHHLRRRVEGRRESTEIWRALELLSLAGSRLPWPLAEAAAGASLSTLLDLGALEPAGPDTLAFAHPLFAEALAAALPPPRLRAHRQRLLAERTRRHDAGHPDEAGPVGDLLGALGRPEQAAPWWLAAGRAALAAGQVAEGVERLQAAVRDLGSGDPERSRAPLELGEVLLEASRFDELEELLVPLLEADPATAAAAGRLLHEGRVVAGRAGQAAALLERLEAGLGADPPAGLVFAQVFAALNAPDLERALVLLDSLEGRDLTPRDRLRRWSFLGVARVNSGDFEGALEAADRLEELGEDDPVVQRTALRRRAEVHLKRGEGQAAVAAYAAVAQRMRALGRTTNIVRSLNEVAAARLVIGDAAGARRDLEDALALGTAAGLAIDCIYLRLNATLAALQLADPGAVHEHLDGLLDRALEVGHTGLRPFLTALGGLASVLDGDGARAAEVLEDEAVARCVASEPAFATCVQALRPRVPEGALREVLERYG